MEKGVVLNAVMKAAAVLIGLEQILDLRIGYDQRRIAKPQHKARKALCEHQQQKKAADNPAPALPKSP